MNRIWHSAAIAAVSVSLTTGVAATEMADIDALKDATLIEGSGPYASAGGDDAFYAGRTNQTPGLSIRRGLLAFDIAGSIPAGSTIESVTLTMTMTQSNAGPRTISLHRTLADWGEGTNDPPGGVGLPAVPGDATWAHTFFATDFWATPGGDFIAADSAATVVDGVGTYFWTDAAMIADVQLWLDDPGVSFGWVILGDETGGGTSKKFASRENTTVQNRPVLRVEYTLPAPCPADLNGDGVVGAGDLAALLAAWGPNPTSPADLDGDGVVGASDLAMLLAAWGPCP